MEICIAGQAARRLLEGMRFKETHVFEEVQFKARGVIQRFESKTV